MNKEKGGGNIENVGQNIHPCIFLCGTGQYSYHHKSGKRHLFYQKSRFLLFCKIRLNFLKHREKLTDLALGYLLSCSSQFLILVSYEKRGYVKGLGFGEGLKVIPLFSLVLTFDLSFGDSCTFYGIGKAC